MGTLVPVALTRTLITTPLPDSTMGMEPSAAWTPWVGWASVIAKSRADGVVGPGPMGSGPLLQETTSSAAAASQGRLAAAPVLRRPVALAGTGPVSAAVRP